MTRILNQRLARDLWLTRSLRTAVALLLCALWPAIVGGETVHGHPSASERLDRFLRDVNTLTVNFKQTLIDEKGKVLEDFTGIAYLKRPRLFRWEYQDPYRQTIVSDGDRVWFHDHELAQVIVKPWGAFAVDTPAAILTMSQPLEEIFQVEDVGDKGGLSDWQWVRLTPKSPDATFVTAEVGFGKRGLEVMKLLDSFGQITWFMLSELNINNQLNPMFFSFTPPEDVDVVGANAEDE
uniref:Outer-membrane lipoprotein carrier protein n=1 Tax=Candidatus Kentrum eta TaxID=2126337 RepID=A0A450VAN5_9GAMM|nr:MAG: outer membrane lipoprotein carrier protein [Candidatus Kentron sp. H]VFK01851.1 MAG: outer membrane lipoprotein carrier protein [Candidatus Kentron sp. H]VFK05346.1 MAG: outer membrane lipoprotein carrier protein [Candidatus Kentron sp. H]